VIVAVAKSLAAFAQGGRSWPRAEAFDGALDLKGYSLEGMDKGAREVRLAELFRHLPVAVLKARFEGALKPARKRGRG
jgi:(1->4)-alpha-D-glucan 1-alpha-D-glucosylmutase